MIEYDYRNDTFFDTPALNSSVREKSAQGWEPIPGSQGMHVSGVEGREITRCWIAMRRPKDWQSGQERSELQKITDYIDLVNMCEPLLEVSILTNQSTMRKEIHLTVDRTSETVWRGEKTLEAMDFASAFIQGRREGRDGHDTCVGCGGDVDPHSTDEYCTTCKDTDSA